MSGTTKSVLIGAGVIVALVGVYAIAKKKGTNIIPTVFQAKQFMDSGVYVQGQTVFTASGKVIGSSIKQINSQGNIYFNNGSILYSNGDLYDSQDNKVDNYANK